MFANLVLFDRKSILEQLHLLTMPSLRVTTRNGPSGSKTILPLVVCTEIYVAMFTRIDIVL